MRQPHPLSPAIHLVADRLQIIGVRARRAAGVTVNRHQSVMPTPGEIFGYMLDTLFADQIYADLEQLERINTLVHSAPEAAPGQAVVDVVRVVLAVGADYREGDVAAVDGLVLRDPATHVGRDFRHERRDVRVVVVNAYHRRVAAGEVPQARLPVLIGLRAGVE